MVDSDGVYASGVLKVSRSRVKKATPVSDEEISLGGVDNPAERKVNTGICGSAPVRKPSCVASPAMDGRSSSTFLWVRLCTLHGV